MARIHVAQRMQRFRLLHRISQQTSRTDVHSARCTRTQQGRKCRLDCRAASDKSDAGRTSDRPKGTGPWVGSVLRIILVAIACGMVVAGSQIHASSDCGNRAHVLMQEHCLRVT